MLATVGVSEVHVIVVSISFPAPSRTVAKSWSWKPTGRAGSLAVRPLNAIVLPAGGGVPPLQAPNVAAAGDCHAPSLFRCRDWPSGVDDDSAAPISFDTMPIAGPLAAVNVPS